MRRAWPGLPPLAVASSGLRLLKTLSCLAREYVHHQIGFFRRWVRCRDLARPGTHASAGEPSPHLALSPPPTWL